ncbi:hypothetical protein [Burkholderia multivorans]|uniref:hypothetical protein n=1 Tax=Burkholderia multivorans TaxID=87883 RepID=UPI002019CA1C|nr:hypothetical protein [Burkholderia multivorans]MCL4652270.1 hypothetical protein [Burkholderia multivorans]MCL4654502.1 hypothetical protein [Burkholderia multivorans]MCO1426779.1 hypothetical protein [Burkholderia multivorans]UQN53571.1 hypothetical protein L0Y88_05650 [Burkholderia multivorans]UQN82085.1 hypothetical protein L0Z18_22950 [Burkholderia multivorans]
MTEQVNPEYVRAVRQALVEWRETFKGGFQAWILETVKTLAIINSAGLAGVAAIFASDGTAKLILGRYPSAALFALGLAAAVVDMYSNARGNLAREREIIQRIRQFDRRELDCRNALDDVQGGKVAFTVASCAGWLSGAAFLAGAWPFIRAALAPLIC